MDERAWLSRTLAVRTVSVSNELAKLRKRSVATNGALLTRTVRLLVAVSCLAVFILPPIPAVFSGRLVKNESGPHLWEKILTNHRFFSYRFLLRKPSAGCGAKTVAFNSSVQTLVFGETDTVPG